MTNNISFKFIKNKRLIGRLENLDPSANSMRQLMFFVGNEIRNKAVNNVTKQRAVSSGILRSSIRFDIRKTKNFSILNVGVWGLPYARIVEYGGPFTDKMRRAMFASFKDRGKSKQPGKGIIRAGYYRKRMYLTPAVNEVAKDMEKMIRDLLSKESK